MVLAKDFGQGRLEGVDVIRKAPSDGIAQHRILPDLKTRNVLFGPEICGSLRGESERLGIEVTFVLPNVGFAEAGIPGAPVQHGGG